jgi:hypothetical protein
METLAERRDVGLSFQIALGIRHQHADAPHPVTLLRPCCARPRRRRAAEEGDELTPFQLTKLHPLPWVSSSASAAPASPVAAPARRAAMQPPRHQAA